MPDGQIALTEGAGKNLQTWTRTVGGQTVQAQVYVHGQAYLPTYTAIFNDIATATANSHIGFIQADGTNYVRLLSLRFMQSTLAGAATTQEFRILRTSTAGTGGTTINARPWDAADTDPYAGTCMTLPTAKGTEGNLLDTVYLALAAAQPMDIDNQYIWTPPETAKPIIAGVATTAGICIKNISAIATAKVTVVATFVLSPYL